MNYKERGESIRVVHPLFQTEGGGSIPTSPLQLHIGEIDLDKAISLNELWHSRLPLVTKSNMQRCARKCCFGAEFDGVFYAVGIWTDPIARMLNGKNLMELRRLAISDEAPKFTASRMLKVMRLAIKKKFPEIEKLISYQDTDVHAGTIYKASGWLAETTSVSGEWSRPNRHRSAAAAPGAKVRWGILSK